jgi:hypothetical protein
VGDLAGPFSYQSFRVLLEIHWCVKRGFALLYFYAKNRKNISWRNAFVRSFGLASPESAPKLLNDHDFAAITPVRTKSQKLFF